MKIKFSKKLLTTLLTSSIILSSVGSLPIYAQDIEGVNANIDYQVNNLNAEQTQLYAQLVNSYNQIETIKEEAEQLQNSISDDNQTIELLNQEIEELQEMIDKRQELIAEQAVAIQEKGGTTNYLNILASSESLSDFVGRMDVIIKLVSSNKDLLNSQKEDMASVEAKKVATEKAKATKVDKMISLEALKGDLEVETASAELAYAELTRQAELAEENRLALEAEAAAFEAVTQVAIIENTQAVEEAVVESSEDVVTSEVAPLETIETSQETTQTAEVSYEVVASLETIESEEAVVTTQAVETSLEPIETTQAIETTVAPVETTQVVETSLEPLETTAVEVIATTAEVIEEVQAPDLSYNTGSLIGNAEKYIGIPYVWGGKSPAGFDCSGFVQYVFKETYGMEIGGWTGAQENAGTRISIDQAQAGDLYFWGSPGGTYHVALATGGGNYIHASQPGTPLGYSNISTFTPSFAVRVL
ncbi:NlpC/P60 family protein [Facklamia sp. P12932]|uniref:C40 family peptidase n=1 Tax=Facklamia sp. P12932 TaxID=3421947 RepID=UPI003D16F68B